jgi:hypothetical protein
MARRVSPPAPAEMRTAVLVEESHALLTTSLNTALYRRIASVQGIAAKGVGLEAMRKKSRTPIGSVGTHLRCQKL